MKRKFYLSMMVMASLLMGFASCSKDKDSDPDSDPVEVVDETAPTLTITIPAATDHIYNMSDVFEFSGVIADETKLKQVTFSLSNSLVAPSAGLKSATSVDPDPWTPADDVRLLTDLKTKTYTVEPLFGAAIPADVLGGTYTLTVTVLDSALNEKIEVIDVTIQ